MKRIVLLSVVVIVCASCKHQTTKVPANSGRRSDLAEQMKTDTADYTWSVTEVGWAHGSITKHNKLTGADTVFYPTVD